VIQWYLLFSNCKFDFWLYELVFIITLSQNRGMKFTVIFHNISNLKQTGNLIFYMAKLCGRKDYYNESHTNRLITTKLYQNNDAISKTYVNGKSMYCDK
jgi:hypothetical protein